MLNLDQVGHPDAAGTILIEHDRGNRSAANDPASRALAERMAQLARQDGAKEVHLGPIYDSDYMPFEARGHTVAGLYESGKYAAYHRDDDTPEKLDYDYLRRTARLVLATLHEA